MPATHSNKVTTPSDALYLAFELGEREWKLAFTVGMAQKPRLRCLPARDLARLHQEIALAKQRFHLPADNAAASDCTTTVSWPIISTYSFNSMIHDSCLRSWPGCCWPMCATSIGAMASWGTSGKAVLRVP